MPARVAGTPVFLAPSQRARGGWPGGTGGTRP
jgi:hypothetical protein